MCDVRLLHLAIFDANSCSDVDSHFQSTAASFRFTLGGWQLHTSPVQTWLIHQGWAQIPPESFAEEGHGFMPSHFYASVVFSARYWRTSDCCAAMIEAVNNCCETRKRCRATELEDVEVKEGEEDVVDLTMEGSKEFKDKPIMQGIQNELKKARLDLAAAELVAIQMRNESKATLAQMNLALQENSELKKVAYSGEVFQKVFDCGFNRAEDSYEKQVAELRLSIFQKVYSPLILLGFNEEEYMNQLTDKEGVAIVEVGTTQGPKFCGSEGEDADVNMAPSNELVGVKVGEGRGC
ncbi:hypothetical protein Acr_18g0007560 [Actinidia rufa]|uniref:Uncharacterized protein n=1 Tax=Actinidia rufa TaxID=165716 RepID=A0A7J0G723_9ERIC|nr:hypothetical protein Acr_18g0007560 [Actinidia rufa]